MERSCKASFCPGPMNGCLLEEAIASPQGQADLVANWNLYQHTCPRAKKLNTPFLLKLAEILAVPDKPEVDQK